MKARHPDGKFLEKYLALFTAMQNEMISLPSPRGVVTPRKRSLSDAARKLFTMLVGWSQLTEQDVLAKEDAIAQQLEAYERRFLQGDPAFSGMLKHGPPENWEQKFGPPPAALAQLRRFTAALEQDKPPENGD